jgi:hypothetical protein
MAKFYGPVGYVVDEEGGPDVIVEKPVEKFYKGDLVKNYRKTENSSELNDNITISNQISIVADAYAYSHMFAMRYVKWMGVAWEVTSVDVQAPRLILSLGGVYNGKTA